ncbi:MAG: hypothetical protein K2I66_00045 [Bacteroidales bacterium]|nr:hypothetical protein [Bacteroidales bacterium]
MKKIVFALLLGVMIGTSAFAQSWKIEDQKNQALELMAAKGVFLVKELYGLSDIRGIGTEFGRPIEWTIESRVMILSDVLAGKKMGCLRLGDRSNIGTLDFDEIDVCIHTLQYIKEKLLPSIPSTSIMAIYTTKDNIEFKAIYDNGWSIYVNVEEKDRSLGIESLDAFITMMQQAKALITEKTK